MVRIELHHEKRKENSNKQDEQMNGGLKNKLGCLFGWNGKYRLGNIKNVVG